MAQMQREQHKLHTLTGEFRYHENFSSAARHKSSAITVFGSIIERCSWAVFIGTRTDVDMTCRHGRTMCSLNDALVVAAPFRSRWKSTESEGTTAALRRRAM